MTIISNELLPKKGQTNTRKTSREMRAWRLAERSKVEDDKMSDKVNEMPMKYDAPHIYISKGLEVVFDTSCEMRFFPKSLSLFNMGEEEKALF